MLCDEAREMFYELIYDELKDENKIVLQEHIESCSSCMKEYKELKLLLIDDMEEIIDLVEEIKMPEMLSLKIKHSIKKRVTKKFFRYAAAACMIFILICGIPVAAQYIIGNSFLDKYKQLDPNIASKYSNYKGEMVEKSTTMKNITFTVDAIIKKSDNTIILFTVKLPMNDEINYAMPPSDMGVIAMQDQFGRTYQSMSSAITLQSVTDDGEIKAIMDFEPLKPYVTNLTVRITAMELGKMTVTTKEKSNEQTKEAELQYDIKKKKNVYGTWQVKFRVH